ncbi:DUF3365 domain-containing protein [Thiotrichales bacterium HSG1]|nr:DUF3365 domain-containing protein [Thiotrichales bacterium HSG1]
MNVQTKLLLVTGIGLFLIFVVVELVHYQNLKQETRNSLQVQAEKVRSLLMAYRHTQQKVFLEKQVPLNDITINFLPAYAIGKISENYSDWDDSGFSFNNVSDQPRNPNNTADTVELKAMEYFRNNPNEKLLFKPFNNGGEQYYLYARPIWIKKLCLKCHAKREDAPATIRKLYDTAWNYKIGDLRGILSIKLPASSINEKIWYSFKQGIIIQLIGFIAIFIMIIVLIRRSIIQPLTDLANSIQTFVYQDNTHRATELKGEFKVLSNAFNNMANDIVAQKNALQDEVNIRKKEQKFVQNVIDSLNHPFYVIDVNTYQVELANLFTKKFGYKFPIACYKLAHSRSTPCNNDSISCPLKLVKESKKPVILEHIYVKKDGSRKNIELHGFPIFDSQNNVVKIIEYSLDITKRRDNEEALRKSENHLSIALKKAEAANQAKSQFLANMSHELRTPMIAIMGYTELMLEDNELTEEQKYYLQSVVTSSENLLAIINDILDASAIDAKKMAIKSVDFQLDQLLNNILRLFNEETEKKGIRLNLLISDDIPNNLIGDPLRIRQVLINLVNNAIKFTKQGGVIICAKVDKQELEQVILRFSVKDTGVGISAKAIPYLFDTFTQADNSYTREFGGTGIGLSICKYLVDMMNGYIWVDSELDNGSTFSFTVGLEQKFYS